MTIHREPFVHLAGLTHDDALIAWGAFFFEDPDEDGVGWCIVEDPDLDELSDTQREASFGVASSGRRPARASPVVARQPIADHRR